MAALPNGPQTSQMHESERPANPRQGSSSSFIQYDMSPYSLANDSSSGIQGKMDHTSYPMGTSNSYSTSTLGEKNPIYQPSMYEPSFVSGETGFGHEQIPESGAYKRYSSFDSTSSSEPGIDSSFANSNVLPATNYHSPYYMPVGVADEPKPVEQLIHRFSIWKMVIKQYIFYLNQAAISKKRSYSENRVMIDNLQIICKQNSGKLKANTAASNSTAKKLRKSMSTPDLSHMSRQKVDTNGQHKNTGPAKPSNSLEQFIQESFLPVGDHSVMSLSATLYNAHISLANKNLETYNQIIGKIIPRLTSLKTSLNEAIKQMCSLKNSSMFDSRDLKTEIAKTGAILSDYICSVELLTKGETRTSLGTVLTSVSLSPKKDPYLLRLKLDLQFKEQLFTEAHLREAYDDLQKKSVQLEMILYKELQNAANSFSNLINAELDSTKDTLISELGNGFLQNKPTMDWDYFISNDKSHNFINLTADESLHSERQIRKKSDIQYPYQQSEISSCVMSGYLRKKSRFLKAYSTFYYVLTFNFLHEFKTKDRVRDINPTASYPLDDMTVEPSKKDQNKFDIHVANKGSKVKYVFECDSDELAVKWMECIGHLCSFGNARQRNSALNNVISASGTATPSITIQHLDSKESLNTDQASTPMTLDSNSKTTYFSNTIKSDSASSLSDRSSRNSGTDESNISGLNLKLPTFKPVKPSQGGEKKKIASLLSRRGVKPMRKMNQRLEIQQNMHESNNSISSLSALSSRQLSPAERARLPVDDKDTDYFNYVKMPAPLAPLRGRSHRRSFTQSMPNSRSQSGRRSQSSSRSSSPVSLARAPCYSPSSGITERLERLSMDSTASNLQKKGPQTNGNQRLTPSNGTHNS